jgi:hypothetical protein
MDELDQDWLDSLPPEVRAVVIAYPPSGCCRMQGDRGHYRVCGYGRDRQTGKVMVELAHGRDSFNPGFAVFGIDPDAVTRCDCGKWERPSPEQVEEAEREVRAIQAARGD